MANITIKDLTGYLLILLHPDGRGIVFTSGKNPREIWTIENFLPPLKVAK